MCIGAQKAGTTWLYANLAVLPGVIMPPIKEIHYFDEIYRKVDTSLLARLSAREGMNKWWWQEKLTFSFKRVIKTRNLAHARWYCRYFFFPRNFNWYERLFDVAAGKISGDITPDYCILDKTVIRSIYERYPGLKIIYIIRNPVDRAWSALKMRYVHRRRVDLNDIDTGLVEDYYREFKDFNDIERTIRNWSRYFPAEQFYIAFYDELADHPVSFMDKLLSYLKVGREYDQARLQNKVFQGVKGVMPDDIKTILSRKAIQQIRFLIEYLDAANQAYPKQWLAEAEKTISS